MGTTIKSRLDRYWSDSDVVQTPLFRENMSRNVFQNIMSNFTCESRPNPTNRNDPNYDKCFKVKPVMEILQDNFIANSR